MQALFAVLVKYFMLAHAGDVPPLRPSLPTRAAGNLPAHVGLPALPRLTCFLPALPLTRLAAGDPLPGLVLVLHAFIFK